MTVALYITCHVRFYLSGKANNLTLLFPFNITNEGPHSVGQYDVSSWSIAPFTSSGGERGLGNRDEEKSSVKMVDRTGEVWSVIIQQTISHHGGPFLTGRTGAERGVAKYAQYKSYAALRLFPRNPNISSNPAPGINLRY